MSLKRNINGTQPDRWKDPWAWDCLTDEQRNEINRWYQFVLEDEKQRKKAAESNHYNASVFGLVPFAVHYAYKYTGGDLNLEFLLRFIAALVVYYIVFFMFFNGYLAANHAPPGKVVFIWHMVVAIFVSILGLSLIYR